jgi:hypothetical protein
VIWFPIHGATAIGALTVEKTLFGVDFMEMERSSMRDVRQTEAISVIIHELRF